MKILHVINELEIGGAQKLTGDMLPVMAKCSDVEVKVAVFRNTDSAIERQLKDAGIQIVNLDASMKSLKGLQGLRRLMKRADIVHVHLFPSLYLAAMANAGVNKPLVYTEHSTHNRRRDKKWLRPLEKIIYGRYRHIGCISPAVAENLSEWIGESIRGGRLSVISNGIDLRKYKESTVIDRKELFGREGKPVLMVSRFTDSKDQPTLIKALSHVEDPEAFVALAGDGERRGEYEKLVKDYGLEDRVMFLGTRSDIPELIKGAEIGVQSSNWEGFGLTAIEMMAGGLPVIASDVEGLREVVEGAGMIFKKHDDKKLAGLIDTLLNDSSLRERVITAGTERSESYSIERVAESYMNLYRQLLKQQQSEKQPA